MNKVDSQLLTPKTQSNKLRLLHLQQILQHETNEQNPLTVEALIQRLYDLGIKVERKTIYADMKILEIFGLDIICEQKNTNHANHYYLGQQQFQLPEIQLLIDTVQFTKFITPKKSRELIAKICQCTNQYDAHWLKTRLVLDDVTKKANEQIYVSLDVINEAICAKQQISFQYFHYNFAREFVAKHEGEIYEVSPYALVPYDQRYYLIAYHPRYEKLVHFRIDMLKSVKMVAKPQQVLAEYTEFNVGTYMKGVFNMMNGEKNHLELCWHKKQWNTVIDRFGHDVFVSNETQTYATIHVEVQCSKAFYAWLCKFGNDVKIVAPQEVKAAYRQYLQAALDACDAVE
ncbi:MAG: helix-turn-helix transcriptional regulator [Culicoidibacterales bacterium]